MTDAMRVHYEGPTVFPVTDREPKRLRIALECPQGLAAGTDVRVMLRYFRAFSTTCGCGKWTATGPG
jgi:hypothetical protein